MWNANTTTADTKTARRYLSTIKTADNLADSLIFRVGPSDAELDADAANPIAESEEAQWTVSQADNGMVYLKNVKTGGWLCVDNTLSATPVSVYPYYAGEDNGRHAFYIETSDSVNRCLNVGVPDATGMNGSVSMAYPANRTRLRWMFEEVDPTVTSIQHATTRTARNHSTRYFTLQGIEINDTSAHRLYIRQQTGSDGKVTSKIIVK